ncbi:hypothetical protein [Spirosoma linguale]|uniref:Uncharacterized protein n=1 Tax=Spirosoma linguale (strain ATCC 33905 / DSM 74 / LMG 10896 / Claus 1) TaxID=504472 RepID=D2QQ51_SPILD|nr:hypothetical protein Slin_3476 [Spirosoma linguale DSM 74]
MDFDDFHWHDSGLKSIHIDRSNPGYNDSIVLEIEWCDIGVGRLIFQEVYKAKFDLNFGIIAQESILDAYSTRDDDELHLLTSTFEIHDLTCYVINTNSTSGQLKIYAKNFTTGTK